VVKIRLQAKEHLGRYRNTFDATAKILRQDGPRAFLVGMAPTAWRNSTWNSVYFSFMCAARRRWGPV
jgi:solute carrier family 25 2-oxodicarboxylate transporter 21